MTQNYSTEAAGLDAEVLACIEGWHVAGFNDLALRIFAHQLRYNQPYSAYCATLGVTPDALPASWEAIPPVPSGAFKETALCTFDPFSAALVFETSGTTQGTGGRHYMESSTLYDAALLAGFRRFMLRDECARLRYLLLVPNPAQRPHSSLGYMMREAAARFGDGREAWCLGGNNLEAGRFIASALEAQRDGTPVCIAGTAFALVQLLDALAAIHPGPLPLPRGSRIMETGGFKGRTRVVKREALYADLAATFAVSHEAIVAEYGMTELTSQYYDVLGPGGRVKMAGPWLRSLVTGADGKVLPDGTVGALRHVDLANRSSCVAVQTEDLGAAVPGNGIVLLGREEGAELRGCSLDAEQLHSLQKV